MRVHQFDVCLPDPVMDAIIQASRRTEAVPSVPLSGNTRRWRAGAGSRVCRGLRRRPGLPKPEEWDERHKWGLP